jgi:hypothetical protein
VDQPRREAAAPTAIAPDLLLEVGRATRMPLRHWARHTLAALPSSGQQPEGLSRLYEGMNIAALIELYRGNLDGARALCELQLSWVEGMHRAHGVNALLLAFRPWLNLGRLMKIEGAPDQALERFAIVAALRAGQEIRVGPMAIDGPTWKTLCSARPALSSELETIYVLESSKVLLAGPDQERTLRFIGTCRAEGVHCQPPYADEAEVIALARLGRHAEALAVTEREALGRGFTAMVARAHRVALWRAVGELGHARKGMEEIFARMPHIDPASIVDQRTLRLMERFGALAVGLEMDGAARRCLHLGLAGARSFGDEPLELAFLEALLAAGAGPDEAALRHAREELLRGCLNVTLLRPRGLEADPAAAADPIFAELRNALAALVS